MAPCWRICISGQAIQIGLRIPLSSGVHKALPFVTLVMLEHPEHVARHCGLNDFVIAQLVQSLAQRHRQLLNIFARINRFIDIALFGLTCIKFVVDTVIKSF